MEKVIYSEKYLEPKLREEVRKLGGYAIKFFAPSFTGLPDRIVLMPGGRVYFIEVKTTGQAPRPRQAIVHKLLRGLGFYVGVIDTKPLLDEFLILIKNNLCEQLKNF